MMAAAWDSSKNGYQGQICGPVTAGEDITNKILDIEAVAAGMTIRHLGIQAPWGTVVLINNKTFLISKACILEFYTTEEKDFITSVIFPNGGDNSTIIDYAIG